MASPQTVVRGNDTSTASYALAPGVFQYIESVLIEVDTSSSGDVTPTLSVQTQDGVTLAEKEQGRSIAAGGSGRATWALRLTDETVASAAAAGQLGTYLGGPQVVPTGSTTRFSWTLDFEPDLLDLTTPDFPAFIAAGTYVLRVVTFASPTFNAAGKVARLCSFMDGFGFSDQGGTCTNIPLDIGPNGAWASITWPWIATAGEGFCVTMDTDRGVNSTWVAFMNVMKIG